LERKAAVENVQRKALPESERYNHWMAFMKELNKLPL
jgi:hypothetical protein